jgi:hypothetical protein
MMLNATGYYVNCDDLKGLVAPTVSVLRQSNAGRMTPSLNDSAIYARFVDLTSMICF